MITATLKRPPGRQDIWAAIRQEVAQERLLTSARLAKLSHVRESDVRLYLGCLVKAGFMRVQPGTAPKEYLLLKDNGREAPRVRRDGTICPPTRRESMWRTMARLSTFSATTLAVAAGTEEVPVSEVDAADYIKHLHRAGYLAVVQAAAPGFQGRTVYRLSKRTGGLPPQVLRTKAVYDPNTSKIEWMDMKGIES